ncbi:hypothetical protein [Jeotgalibacillus sp. R-1-5s-1]|uniref:hypothetical protein n=1 Tax=Jeotgalibacillus sp. R-1-5s-1 TaxID=2555897 RepID=UPI00106C9E6F|nr:hypothetical protein [Jeotgalibacillus sp. R-1-5s-1]TFE00145.1 hypothetical protein E2491_06815 [Jeotgalibacillus sp. R-1-5s-1]
MFFFLMIQLLMLVACQSIYKTRSFSSERYADAYVTLMGSTYGISMSVCIGIYFSAPLWSAVLPLAAGFGFGWLSGKGNAVIAGAMSGLSSGLMGIMLTAALENPALCGIPIQPVNHQLILVLVTGYFGVSVLFSGRIQER